MKGEMRYEEGIYISEIVDGSGDNYDAACLVVSGYGYNPPVRPFGGRSPFIAFPFAR